MHILFGIVSIVFAFLYAFRIEEVVGVKTLGLAVAFLGLAILF